jgi:hypothetical protein
MTCIGFEVQHVLLQVRATKLMKRRCAEEKKKIASIAKRYASNQGTSLPSTEDNTDQRDFACS